MKGQVLRCIIFLLCFKDVLSSAGNVWHYRGSLGPDHWHMDYPHCGGIKQSPIDVVTNDVIVDEGRLTPFVLRGYNNVSNVNMTITNNGHTVQVDLHDSSNEVTGAGLLGQTYVAEQFHFHWGAVDSRGSEHAINGHHAPMEMHVVHYNKKYGNLNRAINESDGLMVMGAFFKVGRFNQKFHSIITYFKNIQYKDTKLKIKPLPLIDFLPDDMTTYYRYLGSLTTPPCYESVTWTLFHDTIEIAEEQLEQFRTTLFQNTAEPGGVSTDISDDYRPVQCMFRRKVYASRPGLKYNPNPDNKNPINIDTQDDNGATVAGLSVITVLLAVSLNSLH